MICLRRLRIKTILRDFRMNLIGFLERHKCKNLHLYSVNTLLLYIIDTKWKQLDRALFWSIWIHINVSCRGFIK